MTAVLSCAETVREFKGAKIYNDSIPQHDLEYLVTLMENGSEKLDEDLKKLGSGQYGTVYGYKDYAIKYSRRHVYWHKEDEPEDAVVLKALQEFDFIPRLYATYGSDYMIVSRVRGMTVNEFIDKRMQGRNIYINPRFNEAFKQALRQIALAGFDPNDMHSKNVMVDYKTGMPMLVDVGFFEKLSDGMLKMVKDSHSIDDELYSIQQAIDWVCERTEKYITADKQKEYKEEMEEKVEAIHNLGDIGEMIMNFKEQPVVIHEQPAIQIGAGGIHFLGQREKITWNAHEMRIKRVASAYKRGIAIMGKQQNLDAIKKIKEGGGVGLDFGRLREVHRLRENMPDIDIDLEFGFHKPDMFHVFLDQMDNRSPMQKLIDSKKNKKHFFQPWGMGKKLRIDNNRFKVARNQRR